MSVHLDLIIEAVVFLTIVGVTWVFGREIERAAAQRRRLGVQQGTVSSSAPLLQEEGTDNRFFQWIRASTSISEPVEQERLRGELLLAGFENPAAPVWFVIARFLLAIGLPLLFLLSRIVMAKTLGGASFIFGIAAFCGIGFLAPSFFVRQRARTRRQDLEIEFPDALDLMVVCVEAGLGMDAAFIRVGEEIQESHPRISREFGRLAEELRAGRSRTEALRAMADRCNVAGIRSFVALAIQTDALGASIAQTLRTYSAEMRSTRFLKAEERAMRIPVLMTIPLVACILPVIIGALMLPAVIDVVRYLGPALRGQ
ncbi:MAG: type II secretion system F family protein [Proteobacteria bacterium]|nr:type II secretion system F family protein [Pseudomonadota bacterium]